MSKTRLLLLSLLALGTGAKAQSGCQPHIDNGYNVVSCGGNSVTLTLNANSISGATSFQWYAYPGGAIAGATTSSYTVTQNGGYGVAVHYSSGCVGSDSSHVYFQQTQPPVVYNPVFCQGSQPNSPLANGQNLRWYMNNIGGTGSSTAPTPNTSTPGTQVYYVSQTINGCESARMPDTVFVRPNTPTPQSFNNVVCQHPRDSVSPQSSGSNIRWYNSNGNPYGGSATPYVYTGNAGQYSFYYTNTNSGACESQRAYSGIYIVAPAIVHAYANPANVMIGDSIKLTGSSNVGGTFSWTGPNGFTSSNYHAEIPNATTAMSGYYKLTVTDTVCGPVRDSVLVHVGPATDFIWPGDVDRDLVADNNDVLEILLHLGDSGLYRVDSTTNWSRKYSADWTLANIAGSINNKNGDCNGDHLISYFDIDVVNRNYGRTHQRQGNEPSPAKVDGAPSFAFNTAGITLTPGQRVSIPVTVGSPVDNLVNTYGYAAKITVGGIAVTDAEFVYAATNLLSSNNNAAFQFVKSVSASRADFATSATDRAAHTGYGTIGYLKFTVPQNAAGQTADLRFADTRMMNPQGQRITSFNVQNTTLPVRQTNEVKDVATVLGAARIAPNPSGDQATLMLSLNESSSLNVRVTDLAGRTVWTGSVAPMGREVNMSLPAGTLQPGIYSVIVSSEAGSVMQTLKWVKQ